VANEPDLHATAGVTTLATLVDSSVLLDVLTDDQAWAQRSGLALAQARDAGRLVINPIVYAEISTGFARVEDLDNAVPRSDFEREPLPYPAGFLAAKAFLAYRKRGGERRSPLPDFYIGAHAAVARYRLLTRDATRYRTYFPSVEVLAP
jgi:predicted nucleic acid-binding protein